MTLYQKLKKRGFDFFVGVPCSGIKQLIHEAQNDQSNTYIPVTREDEAVAIATGAYLAGKKPLVFMQSSGLGNTVNIVTSLLKPYDIHVHFLISIRKSPFEHSFMYKITKNLIKLLEYKHLVTYIFANHDEA